MARLYANENFPTQIVDTLRRLGYDVLTTLDAGKAGRAISDEEVLTFAIDENRIVLTFNRRHFIRLHHEQPNHAGIIVCTVDPDFDALASRINTVLAEHDEWHGCLARVNRPPQ